MEYSPSELEQLDKKFIWHPFTQMQDYLREQNLIIDRAEGVFLFDVYGKKYIDGVSSLWVNVHGHQKKEINEALKAQIDKICHATLLGQSTTVSTLFAKKLLEVAPKNLTRIFYSDNGATSVEVALKMAYQYFRNLESKNPSFKSRVKYINLEEAYHGDTLGSVSIGGIELFHSLFKKLIFDPITIKDFSLDHASELFVKHGHELAACVVEPMIQGAAGMRIAPKGFLTHLRELCDTYGVFLICDEVATGFGRTGKMFAVEHEGVAPDFLCVAKGITGGYLPLAATLTTDKVFEGFCADYRDFKTFFHGHSYTGNPLACAAALANLEIFEKEKVIDVLQPKIEFLRQELDKFKEHSHIGEVRQLGFMVGMDLVADKKAGLAYPVEEKWGHKVVMESRKHGIIIRPLGNTLVLMPPLSIDLKTLKELCDGVYEAASEVCK